MGSPPHATDSSLSRRRHCVRLDPTVRDVPLDWSQESDLDVLDFAGLLDVLTGPWAAPAAPPAPAGGAAGPGGPAAVAAPGGLSVPSDRPRLSISSSAGMTDDLPGSQSPSRQSSLRSMRSARRPSLSSSSSSSSPDTPVSPSARSSHNSLKGKPGGGRPEGKFPLCPEGRCDHTEHWVRVRTKQKYVFFMCTYCGLGWSSYKLSGFVGGPKALCVANASNAAASSNQN